MDYTQAFPEDLADTIPDTVVYNFRHTVVQDGAIRFVLEAEKAETWEKSGRITMKGVSFTEYSARPEAGGARPEAGGAEPATSGSSADSTENSLRIVASGQADSAVFFTRTESAELKGNVEFSAPEDDIAVRSGNLSWDGDKRTLASQLDTLTMLSSGQSSISGAGFSANARNRSFRFQETVIGRFIPDEKAAE
ncbi:MAG: LPS export ABC transporter periplasmic protein LptC [Spirochaetes bacterium]|nr:LPS export ABC transporter periplasmic protein LptC [Spirochaetota bacterium]